MATAYSTLLGLALPVQGELSGTWGDTVDNGITRYVDIAVAGTVTLTNDGAVTLSLTNGDASATNIVSSLTGAGTVSAQFAIIKVTGTLTTAKILTPPSSSRTYVVVNAATGSTVTVKASGQTGVSIAVGETAFVYFNGTDYVKVAGTVNTGVTSFQTSLSGLTPSTSTTGAVTLAGTLGTANGGTNLTSFTSGGVVYASSSSALATGSVLNFDGTNLGLGGTSASARLYVNANNATATQILQDETNGAKLRVITNSINVDFGNSGGGGYIAVSGANPLTFNTNGAEGFRLTSSSLYTASGINVGIGTSNPTSYGALGVGKAVTIGSISVSAGFSDAVYNTLRITHASGSVGLNFDDTNLIFQSGGISPTTRMTLNSAGNLGLGVTPSATNTSYKAQEIGFVGNGLIGFGANDFAMSSGAYYSSSGWKHSATNSLGASFYEQYTGQHIWYNKTAVSHTAGDAITFTQAMTLHASGGLTVGGISDPGNGQFSLSGTSSARINVRGSSGNASFIFFSEALVADRYLIGSPASSGDLVFRSGAYDMATGTERARLTQAGGWAVGTTADPGAGAIYATGNITAYYSDARLKTVSGKIENALDKVAQLSGVYYTNNSVAKSFGYDSDEVQVGVLAQDVEAVLPQIVKAAPFDLDQDGNSKSGENYKTVQYERLVPLLIEAINELQAKVKALEAK